MLILKFKLFSSVSNSITLNFTNLPVVPKKALPQIQNKKHFSQRVNMINNLSKINLSRMGWEGGGSTSIWIMSLNKLGLSWAKLCSNWNWNFVILLFRLSYIQLQLVVASGLLVIGYTPNLIVLAEQTSFQFTPF